jgi:general L-amino acid transport system permease protein
MPQTEPPVPEADAPSKASFWYDPKVRAVFYQIGALAMVGMLAYYLMSNTMANLERQAIATGFEFLEKQASFEIGESLIAYTAADS